MKAKNLCVLSLIKYFEKPDGYCYFKRKDLYNLLSCCGENGLRLVIDKLEEEGYIENKTVNGYVTKIKILDPTIKCYDFMLLKNMRYSHKALLYDMTQIDIKDWFGGQFVSNALGRNVRSTRHSLSMIRTFLDIEETMNNLTEVKCDESYLTDGCIKDENGIKFSTGKIIRKCIYCGETNEDMFTFDGKRICRACLKDHVKERSNDVAKDLYSKSRDAAKQKGRDYNLTKEYIEHLLKVQDYKCAYSKINFNYNIKNYIPSVDRIDSSKGYIEGNVQWVTYQANLSKHVMTMEQLYEFCRKVLNHANQQPSQRLTTLEGSETN